MRTKIEQSIDPALILGLRVIFGSFLFGILIFLSLSVFMYLNQSIEPPSDIPLDSNSRLITLLALGYMIIAIPVSGFIFKKILKTDRKSEPFAIVSNIRSAMLARVAIFEGAALLAATAIFVSVIDGFIYGNPIIWLNIVPLAYFTMHIAVNFPSKEKILSVYDDNFL